LKFEATIVKMNGPLIVKRRLHDFVRTHRPVFIFAPRVQMWPTGVIIEPRVELCPLGQKLYPGGVEFDP
jgi:hypothetical protein